MAGNAKQSPRRRGRPPSGGREAILEATLELVRERGIARMTTREVAERAGVSEASVFYHYTDRAGLLQALFARGLEPLRELDARGIDAGDRLDVFTRLGTAIEQFLGDALPILLAAQSDTELRDKLAVYMAEQDLGPHRGVQALGAYLTVEQAAGRARREADPEAIAFMLVASSFVRVFQRQIAGDDSPLPSLEDTVSTLDVLLRPDPG
jgi:AcrR family transcriptional regulator